MRSTGSPLTRAANLEPQASQRTTAAPIGLAARRLMASCGATSVTSVNCKAARFGVGVQAITIRLIRLGLSE
jgi:hypothetical protein